MSQCLSDSELKGFHAQLLTPISADRVRSHLAHCPQCLQRGDRIKATHCDIVDAARAQFSDDRNTRTAMEPSRHGDDPPPDIQIDGYDILRELGRGGQGVVYQAVQRSTKSKVAIKVLLHGAYASESARRRFLREIEMVAQLRHPNIISIFGSGEAHDGRLYYVMDYVRGLPLSQYIHDHASTLQDTLKLFGSVCDAVQFAHARGIIHRDLKPSNVRVDAAGNPKLLDFGLARRVAAPGETLSQAVIGTLPYLSPEQTRGNPDQLDTRSDVYSLGVMLYELLTGHYPYPVSSNVAETIRHIAESPPTPPARGWSSNSGVTRRSDRHIKHGHCPIDDEIQTVVLKALQKSPDRRYQSAGELASELRRYLSGDAIEAKRDSKWYLLRVSVRHHKKAYAAMALIAVLGIASGANYIRSAEQNKLQAILVKGMNAQWSKSYRTAVEHFDHVLARDPGNATALKQKAHCLRILYLEDKELAGDARTLQQAIAALEQLGDLEGKAPAFNLIGTLYRQNGDYANAEAYLQKALRADHSYYYANSNLAKTLAAQYRFDEALQATTTGLASLQAATATTLSSDGIWVTHAALQLHAGSAGAIDSLRHALAIDGEDPRSRMMLARCFLDPAFLDPPRALEEALNARLLSLNEGADGRLLRMLALAHLRNDHDDAAEEHAELAARHGSANQRAYSDAIRAIVAARQGRVEAAQTRVKTARAEWPPFNADGVLVSTEREILWIDTQRELEDLVAEAEEILRN